MRKSILLALVVLLSVPMAFPSIVTNTNQSIGFYRLLARFASLETDAVYYNPAGLTKLKDGFHLSVVNMPWLNRFDTAWLSDVVKPFRQLFVLDDHAPTGGLGDGLLNALNTTGLLAGRTLCKMAVEGYPVCGTPTEALKQHQLDGDSLATRILRATRTK